MAVRPGGALTTRPLHFVFLVDCSGSMSTEGKIQAVNTTIRETIPLMQAAAEDNPNAEVLFRVITFSTGAQWHIPRPTPAADFRWADVQAGGVTELGHALALVREQLRVPPMSERALPPVLVLLSDGQPTDSEYHAELQALLSLPWGRKAVRIAIAIGADADHEVLQQFIANPEIKVMQASNPEALLRHISWASTLIGAISSPPSQLLGPGSRHSNVPIPTQPSSDPHDSEEDLIW